VNPVVAVVLGWLILGEPLTARSAVAAGVIVLAVALIVTGRSRGPAAPRHETGPATAEPSGG
jgi:drug/metabolite transporter (DMT)-like permease